MVTPDVAVVFRLPAQLTFAPSLPAMGRKSRVENKAVAPPARAFTVATPPPLTSMASDRAVAPEVIPCSSSNSLSVTRTVLASSVTGP